MAYHEIKIEWTGKMQFNSLVNGHTIIMDAPKKTGGEYLGSIPELLILSALSGWLYRNGYYFYAQKRTNGDS